MKPSSASSRPVRKSSSALRSVVKSVGVTSSSKGGKTMSWHNILEVLRARLSFCPRDPHYSEVMIQDAAPAFVRAFGLSMEPPPPFSVIFGKTTIREFQTQVERALLTGQTIMKYVNLHRADGAVLSCHVVIRPIPSGPVAQSLMLRRNHSDERFALLTIRSASAVGNANFVGVGLLGVDRIPHTMLERVIDGATKVNESPTAAVAAAELLNLGNMEHFDEVEMEGPDML